MASLIGRNDFLGELFSAQQYKPGQGTRARYFTWSALAVLILLAAWSWESTNSGANPVYRWGIPYLGALVGLWVAYRLIHYPRFADFLITTEAEMNKVSWPTKPTLKASTIVVLILVVLMAALLFVADFLWRFLLEGLGILKVGGLLTPDAAMLPAPPIRVLLDLFSPLF